MSSLANPYPFGCSFLTHDVNFAVYGPQLDNCTIFIFHPDTQEILYEQPMRHRQGHVWFDALSIDVEGCCYLYGTVIEVDGVEEVQYFSDPFSRELISAWHWDKVRYEKRSHLFYPKTKIVQQHLHRYPLAYKIAPDKRAVYEMHVKSISMRHPEVPEKEQGTYVGATHPAIIDHLKQLGITTVQLMPVMAYMPEPFITEKGLTNFWGYNPASLLAPEPRYAMYDAHKELQVMIKEYHKAGLEVIIDVVFNHTAESGPDGPILNLRATCEDEAYTRVEGTEHYANYSGCGNSLNLESPYILTLVLEAMRHWVQIYGVDGFRFDLATGLGREPHTYSSRAAFFKAVQQDPILRNTYMIAEPWDLGDYGYQLGQFPVSFAEVNDQFRDVARGFWRGDRGLTGTFATRMFGSRDIFHKGYCSIHTSVNPITYHDGFTLHDLVSYNEKHNDANLEDNRDGHNHNLSYNYGVEGPTEDPVILSVRERQKRNMIACMVFAQGTPHFLSGDELSKTQHGNNNAYCQDNEMNYLDWDLVKSQQDFLSFCQYCLALKRNSRILTNAQLDDDDYRLDSNIEFVKWYKIDGSDKGDSDWEDPDVLGFAVEMCEKSQMTPPTDAEHWLLCVNASTQDDVLVLPKLPHGARWEVLLDTRMSEFRPKGNYIPKPEFVISNRSVVLFKTDWSAID